MPPLARKKTRIVVDNYPKIARIEVGIDDECEEARMLTDNRCAWMVSRVGREIASVPFAYFWKKPGVNRFVDR
jgi:hypothetical protein